MNEKFLEVGDVMQILGISRSAAYKLMRQINSELEKKGRNVWQMESEDTSLTGKIIERALKQYLSEYQNNQEK